MARPSRDERLLLAISKVLDPGEDITDRGKCWAAVRGSRTPLLFLGRHQYEVVLTDRRAMLFSRRRRRRVRTDDVALAKRYESLSLEAEHRRYLLQHLVNVDRGQRLVIEWRPRQRAIGHRFAGAIAAAHARETATTS
jgi:hypothetical protein